jgi:hypothetical protein
MQRNVALLLAFVAGCGLSLAESQAQTSESSTKTVRTAEEVIAPSDMELDLLRSDLRSQKKQIIAANMKLTDKEAEKFWPVYDQYTAELIKINDSKYALIQKYAENYGKMTDQQAEEYFRGLVDADQSVTQLRLKYWPKFRESVSTMNTALFFQLDRRITAMIDVQLASQLPLIKP